MEGRQLAVRIPKRRKRYRGSRTQGFGRIGQHRKSGGRGGSGRAGLHKHKWSWTVKYAPDAFGKHGFSRPWIVAKRPNVVNVGVLDEVADGLLRSSRAVLDNGRVVIDTVGLGVRKVLGAGHVSHPMLIKAHVVAKSAVTKIREAGGEVVQKTADSGDEK